MSFKCYECLDANADHRYSPAFIIGCHSLVLSLLSSLPPGLSPFPLGLPFLLSICVSECEGSKSQPPGLVGMITPQLILVLLV